GDYGPEPLSRRNPFGNEGNGSRKINELFEREGNNTDSEKYVTEASRSRRWLRIALAERAINDQRSQDQRKLFEKVAPAVKNTWFSHNVWDPEQRKDKIEGT